MALIYQGISLTRFNSTGPGICFFWAVSRATASRGANPSGRSLSPALTSERRPTRYPSMNGASTEAVHTAAPAVAPRRANTTACNGGGQICPFEAYDHRGTELFEDLPNDVSSAWAPGSITTYYTGPWNLFVRFCNDRVPPLCPLQLLLLL